MKTILLVVSFALISCTNCAETNVSASVLPIPTDPALLKDPQLETKWQDSSSTTIPLFEGVDLHHGVTFHHERKTIVVSSWVSLLQIICSAHYPIYWNHDDITVTPADSSLLTVTSISTTMQRVSVNFADPSSYLYYATLVLRGDGRRITGEYSCKSTTNEKLETSRFIFWEGTSRNLKFGEMKNPYLPCTTPSCKDRPAQTVKADKDNQTIILPCSVSNPHTKVHLSKKNTQATTASLSYTEIAFPNDGITFDPKVGFILKVQALPSPYGIYKCVVKCTTGYSCSDEVFIVNASSEIEPEIPLVTKDVLESPKAKYDFDSSSNQITCCSNGAQPPRIYQRNCKSKLDCEKAKSQVQKLQYFDRSDSRSANCLTFTVKTGESLGVFRCMGEGIDVIREYYISNQVYTENVKYETDDQSDYSGEGSGNGESAKSVGGSGKQSITRIYYDDDISKLPKFHFIDISGASTEYGYHTSVGTLNGNTFSFYSNSNITMFCKPTSYLFTLGVRWSIGLNDGTTYLIPAEKQSSAYGSMSQGPGQGNSVLLLLRENMVNISCHAPFYNSSDWATRTLTFNLTKTVPPTIEGTLIEYINWKLGDTNKTLACASSGQPMPGVTWTYPWRYDYYYTSRMWTKMMGNKEVTNDGKGQSTVKFLEVLETMAGSFTCTARNLVGSTTKTFVVTIDETTTTATPEISISTRSPDSTTEKPANAATSKSLPLQNPDDKPLEPTGSNSSLVVALVFVSIALAAAMAGMGFLCLKNKRQQRAFDESTNQDSVSWKEMAQANTVYHELS